MKKFLAVVLSVVVIICAFAGCSSGESSTSGSGGNSSESAASNLDYFEVYNGEITGLTEEGAKQKELIIPENITSIDERAFAIDEYGESNDVLEKVSFLNPDCQLSVNSFVYCTALTEIELPENVKEIPKGCFSHCESLKSVIIPDSVTSVGEKAFYEDFALESVTFGDSLVSIGEEAFRECTALSVLEFNSGLKTIGDYAFADCKSITNIVIPESVTSIGAGTFSNAYNTSGEYKITVTQGSWADINFDSYKSGDENVQKVYA